VSSLITITAARELGSKLSIEFLNTLHERLFSLFCQTTSTFVGYFIDQKPLKFFDLNSFKQLEAATFVC